MTPSTPKLSEAARHLVIPDSIKTSTFPRVYRRLQSVGVTFDRWQEGLGQAALGCRSNGKYAATIGGVVASIPRQVGKTFTVGNLLIGLALEFSGMRIVWTSHHSRTTTNTFRSMQGMVRRKKILPLLAENGIRTANGEQEIRFANGSIIMFGAREHGFGRGMDAIDVLVFDEAQILGLKALEDMVPATNQARNPHGALVFFIGTPPRPVDDGEAFMAKRQQAISGKSSEIFYVELSADPDASPDDHAQWRKANPSFPTRTPVESMLRMRENIPDVGSWRREALGIWDDAAASSSRLVTPDDWTAVQTEQAPPDGIRSFAVAFNYGGERGAIAGAVKHDNGVHLELIGTTSAAGLESVAEWLAARRADAAQFTLSGGAMAKVLHQLLRDKKVPERQIVALSTAEYFASCGMLLDSVKDKTITVPKGDPATDPLELSVAVSDKKVRGGSWGWQATTPDGDETPMEAISAALYGARTTKRRPGRRQVVL